jgi:hypothetical protein
MPALDSCEAAIVHALEKEGWQVLDKPYPIRVIVDNRVIFADIRLQQQTNQQQIIVVEVKCFPNNRSALDEFYRAIGQYQVYRNGLQLTQNDTPTLQFLRTFTRGYFRQC